MFLKVFLFLALAAIFSAEQNNFSNFRMGSLKENFCEIILKLGHLPMRRCRLKKLLMNGQTEDRQILITIARAQLS